MIGNQKNAPDKNGLLAALVPSAKLLALKRFVEQKQRAFSLKVCMGVTVN